MIRYLTHKFRTQSLTEPETYHDKTDDDRDSGTESDDEGADIEELQKYMESIIQLDGTKPDRRCPKKKPTVEKVTPSSRRSLGDEEDDEDEDSSTSSALVNAMCLHGLRRHSQDGRASKGDEEPESPVPEPALDSALPSDSDHNFDHHSSEEELEVINGEVVVSGQPRETTLRQRTAHPEKRKWSQAALSLDESGGSSDDDDEVRDLMWCDALMAPVQFRTSPPANVHKPRKCLSPPPKVFHLASVGGDLPPHELCSVSPRKRHRRTQHTTTAVVLADRSIQRPCLDFEKMQQIRVRLL